MAADLVQEELQRVRGDGGQRDVVDGRGGSLGAAAVVLDVDPLALELLVEAADVGVRELQRLGQLVDLGELEATRFLSSVDQGGDCPSRGVIGR